MFCERCKGAGILSCGDACMYHQAGAICEGPHQTCPACRYDQPLKVLFKTCFIVFSVIFFGIMALLGLK